MQLKTYLSIGTGIAVGVIFGMGVSEKTKSQVLTKVKKKIVEALTGEKWEPKRYAPPKRTTYASYCTYAKPKVEMKKDILDSDDSTIKTMLLFETQKEAKDTILRMDEYLQSNAVLSVYDLSWMRGRPISHTWDKYGWTKEEVDEAHVADWEPDNPLLSGYKYKIEIAKAHCIS